MYEVEDTTNYDLFEFYNSSGERSNESFEDLEELEQEEGTEETEESSDSKDLLEFGDDEHEFVINYQKLSESVRSAQTVTSLDTDLDNLQVTDVSLLLALLVIALIIIIGGR